MTMTELERKAWTPEDDAPKIVLDIEDEFALHFSDKDSLEYFLREGVSQDLLYRPRIKSIFQFASHHFNTTGKAPSLAVLDTEFPDYDFIAPQSEHQWVVEKLRERYQRNKVDDLTTELAKRIDTPADAMSFLRDQFIEIEKTSLSSRHIFKPGDYKLFITQLQEEILAGQYRGASIGYQEIDDYTGGTRDGQIAYILARPKRQKTFNVLQAFIMQALQDRKPILNTLELSEKEIKLRLSCMLSGVPWDRAQKGALMPSDYKDFERAWAEFDSKVAGYFIEAPAFDERTVPSLVLKADKLGAESILISQFKYVNGSKDYYRNPYDESAEVAVALKQACTRPGAERPFFVEAQFNRGGDSMEELEDFDASKVGLTDMIPQSADILFGLFQSKDLRASGQLEYGIIESRNTDKAAWYLRTEFKTTTELELVKGSQH